MAAFRPAQSPPQNAQEFHDKDTTKPRNDFASFVNKGDDRLKLLEHSDKLPDLQSDFATSKARMLMKQTQELQSGRGPNRISADKLGQILKEMERRLVGIVSDAIAGALPSVAKKHDLLMPLTMSLFGMLNWHYLWFRDGKGMTREAYARMVVGLVLAGADEAIADVESSAKPPKR